MDCYQLSIDLFLKYNFLFSIKMDSSNKNKNDEVKKEAVSKAKYQSVEGSKIYKTRKYVQTTRTRLTAEARRKRDQYLIDHKEEILKLDVKGRVKKVVELLKQDLNLNISYKTLYPLLNKYVSVKLYSIHSLLRHFLFYHNSYKKNIKLLIFLHNIYQVQISEKL